MGRSVEVSSRGRYSHVHFAEHTCVFLGTCSCAGMIRVLIVQLPTGRTPVAVAQYLELATCILQAFAGPFISHRTEG